MNQKELSNGAYQQTGIGGQSKRLRNADSGGCGKKGFTQTKIYPTFSDTKSKKRWGYVIFAFIGMLLDYCCKYIK